LPVLSPQWMVRWVGVSPGTQNVFRLVKYPVNFKEFWDVKKFPGRRTLRARPTETLEIALVGDGVEPRKMYPLDVERAFKSLDRIKSYVPKWIKETPQATELLLSNEVDFSYVYHGRAIQLKKDGKPVEFSFEQTIIGNRVPHGPERYKEQSSCHAVC